MPGAFHVAEWHPNRALCWALGSLWYYLWSFSSKETEQAGATCCWTDGNPLGPKPLQSQWTMQPLAPCFLQHNGAWKEHVGGEKKAAHFIISETIINLNICLFGFFFFLRKGNCFKELSVQDSLDVWGSRVYFFICKDFPALCLFFQLATVSCWHKDSCKMPKARKLEKEENILITYGNFYEVLGVVSTRHQIVGHQ